MTREQAIEIALIALASWQAYPTTTDKQKATIKLAMEKLLENSDETV